MKLRGSVIEIINSAYKGSLIRGKLSVLFTKRYDWFVKLGLTLKGIEEI